MELKELKQTSHATIKPYPEVIIRRTLHYREKRPKSNQEKKKYIEKARLGFIPKDYLTPAPR